MVKKAKFMSTLLLAGFAMSGHARVYEYAFKDINGSQKSILSTTNDTALNPEGKLDLVLIAGLDQKIQIKILNSQDISVYSTLTPEITVDNRVTSANGTSFYGLKVTIPPLSDGKYTVISEILDVKGKFVSTTSHSFLVDTSGPMSDKLSVPWIPGYGMVNTGELWELGRGQERTIYVSVQNIKDLSGLDYGIIQVLNPDGTVFSSYKMTYEEQSSSLSAPITKGYSQKSDWMPLSDADTIYRFHVTLYDKAGNSSELAEQKFIFDSTPGEHSLFAVYDPDYPESVVPGFSSGYISYKPGLAVNTNPVTFIYKLPSSNYRPNNKVGLQFGSLLTEFDGYSYIKVTTPVGTAFTIHNAYQWGGGNSSYNVVLSDKAPLTPKINTASWDFSTYGILSANGASAVNMLWPARFIPGEYTSMTINVEPRPYVQYLYNNTDSKVVCQIPVGESSCTGPFNYKINPGHGALTHQFFVRSTSSSFRSNYLELRSMWNTDWLPVITGYNYSEEDKIVNLFVTQPGNGSWREFLKLAKTSLVNRNNGNIILSGKQIAMSGDDYTFSFDLNSLDEGRYDLEFTAQDTAENITTLPFRDLIIDKTPPEIEFKLEGSPLINDSTVYGLEHIKISVADLLSSSSVTKIVLRGGPTSDEVELGFTNNGDGTYTLLYPRIFPSLDESSDKYTLEVYASDSYGNTTFKSVRFAYYPNNLVTLEKLKTLGVGKALKTSDNTPLAVMRTSQLRKDDGSLARGVQTANVTLRADADYAINILDTIIQPGDTREIQIDLGVGENSAIPIFPAANDSTGQSNFIVEFPQIK